MACEDQNANVVMADLSDYGRVGRNFVRRM